LYKFVVVTDPDTASGFRLAGVDVLEAPTIEEAKRIITSLLFKDDTGIVAVNEDFIDAMDEKVMERIEKTYRPIVISIPSRARRVDRAGYIERLLRRAIGYKIVVRR
jgi:V/A-type H+/Na+-transporting ATPase subunit F